MGRAGTSATHPAVGDRPAAPAACEAAHCVRLIVRRLPFPAHVAGYLRGYADSLEAHCTDGETGPDDVIDAGTRRLAGYLREPAAPPSLDVDDQRSRIEAAAGRGRFTVSSWHDDRNGHARNRRTPGLQEARSAVRNGRAGGIVVAEIGRLGRNSLDVLDLVERSHSEGWRLVALDCRLDSSTPSGELVVDTLRAARRLEWRKAPDERRPRRRTGREARPSPAPADVDAAIVERIAAMRRAGQSIRAIAAELNADGPDAPQGHERWQPSSVRRVLQRARGSSPGA